MKRPRAAAGAPQGGACRQTPAEAHPSGISAHRSLGDIHAVSWGQLGQHISLGSLSFTMTASSRLCPHTLGMQNGRRGAPRPPERRPPAGQRACAQGRECVLPARPHPAAAGGEGTEVLRDEDHRVVDSLQTGRRSLPPTENAPWSRLHASRGPQAAPLR